MKQLLDKGYDTSTSKGLINLAKHEIINMLANVMEVIAKIGNEDDEYAIDHMASNLTDSYKFYAKVRYGEVWSKEDQEKRINEINEELRWKEV